MLQGIVPLPLQVAMEPILASFYMAMMNTITKSNLERKGLIWVAYPGPVH